MKKDNLKKEKYPWFKLYSDFLYDPKIRRLNIFQRYIWIGLMCLASESPIRGQLFITEDKPLTMYDIVRLLDISYENVLLNAKQYDPGDHLESYNYLVEDALKLFEELDMITIYEDGVIELKNWIKRQGSDHPKAVTERVRLHRERMANISEGKNDENDTNVTGNVTHVTKNVTDVTKNVTNVTKNVTKDDTEEKANISEGKEDKSDMKRGCNENETAMKRPEKEEDKEITPLTPLSGGDKNKPKIRGGSFSPGIDKKKRREPKPLVEFDDSASNEYIEELIVQSKNEEKNLSSRTVGMFFKYRRDFFENNLVADSELRRNLKGARILASLNYEDDYYYDLFFYSEEQLKSMNDGKNVRIPTLDTVLKFRKKFEEIYPDAYKKSN